MKKIIFLLVVSFLIGCTNNNKKTNEFSDKNEYYILRGINYLQVKDYVNAIKELETVYKKDNKNIVVMRELAYCYGEIGEREKAVQLYERVLLYEPKDEVALKNLAYIHYLKGDYKSSKSYISRVTGTKNDIYLYKMKGYLSLSDSKYEDSHMWLSKALEIDEVYDGVFYRKYINLLKILSKKDEIYKLIEAKYPKYSKNRDYIIIYSTVMLEEFNESSKSELAIKRYLVDNPKDSEMLLTLIEIKLKSGDYNKSRELLTFVNDEYKYDKRYLNIVDILDNNK